MKTISIGDIHGNPAWKQIEIEKYDKIIFLGDYVDHYTRTDEEILQNLINILNLKQQNPDKVILLLGNHDLFYIHSGAKFNCSRTRRSIYDHLHSLYTANISLFQHSFQYRNYLWTHAGLLSDFEKRVQELKSELNIGAEGMANILNAIPAFFLADCGWRRRGEDPHGGIFWADSSEHMRDPGVPYHQICGHNRFKAITTWYPRNKSFDIPDEECSITFTDVLDTRTEFYEKEI